MKQALILETRQSRSKPIVNAIGQRANDLRVIPGTPLVKALTHLDKQWPAHRVSNSGGQGWSVIGKFAKNALTG